MCSALNATNKPDLLADDALANELASTIRLRCRHRIEQDLRRVGITDTTPLELADRIIADAMHSAYACMLSAHKLTHAGIAKGREHNHRRQSDGET
ncbi:hypothetical protein [Halomonas sp. HAL1]|uniref:hypothetical protein n=1 Tax=Halomonas sp. HAL1 TaxID=550984 RepID=UPI0026E06F02|nr:hypothetical protein [Halomonas sp. HAL1]WKV95153.1 hypothetical protein Q3Y66_19800 [Halomonas sp. HAL1]